MALTAGELQILIDVNTGEIDKLKKKLTEVKSQTKKTQVGFASLAGSFFTAQAALGLVTKGLSAAVQGFKFAINTARDLEESQNKLNVTFRSLQKEANGTRDALVKGFGFSKKAATELLGATGDLLTGLGFTQEKSLDLSKQVQELSADLASFQNLEGGAARASEALTKALLGETESAKALGIVVRQDTKEFKEAVTAIQKQTGATLAEAKAEVILQQALTQSKNAIGDFARTSDNLANRQRQLKNVQEDVAGAIGKNFTPVLNLITGQLLKGTKRLKEFFEEGGNVKKIQTGIKIISVVFFTLFNTIKLNFLIFKSFNKIIITLAQAFFTLLKPAIDFVIETVVKFAKAIKEKLEPVLKAIGKAIDFVTGKAKDLSKTFKIDIEENVNEKKILDLKGAFDTLGQGIGSVKDDFSNFVGDTASGINEILNMYKEAETKAKETDITPGKKKEKEKEGQISIQFDTEGFTESSNEVANSAGELQNKLLSGFGNAFNKINDKSASFLDKFTAVFMAVTDVIKGALDVVNEVINQSFETRLENLEMQHESEIEKIDERLARELELLENDGMTKEEKLQQDIANLRAAGQEEEAVQKEKELRSLQLTNKANKQKEEAAKALAKKQHKIQVEQFRANQALQAANATIAFAQGLVSMWSTVWSIGNPIAAAVLGGVFSGVLAGVFAAQLATILSQSPPAPPRFQQGGTVSAIVGERGAEIAQFPVGTEITDAKTTRNILNQPVVIENRLFIGEDEIANVVSRANINNQQAQINR